jgi:uncharacterized protein YcnI
VNDLSKLRRLCAVFVALVLSLVLSTSAFAHVTVLPREAVQGAYEKFTVRVPNEKDIPTVQVEVRFPKEVSISRFEPKPDWTYELTKDGSGAITGVVWKTAGAGLGPTEFGEFHMQGKVANDAESITWKAYQTYKDGSVVEWVGADGSDKPASVTAVKPGAAGTDSHGHSAGAEVKAEQSGAGSLPLYVSIAALVVSLVALVITATRRK